jgi:predicted ATPase
VTHDDADTYPDPHDEELAARGRGIVAAAAAGTRAPLALRERIDADRARGRRRSPRRLPVLAAGLVAAAVLAIVLVSGGGGGGGGVLAAAALAARGPAQPAPAEDPANPALLASSMQGVAFPYWDDAFGWRAVGARHDTVDGRPAKTVFYDDAKRERAAYTIVGGTRIDPLSSARVRTRNGTKLWISEHEGRRIVTWERGGHTCVMSAPLRVPEDVLLALASWNASGGVRF